MCSPHDGYTPSPRPGFINSTTQGSWESVAFGSESAVEVGEEICDSCAGWGVEEVGSSKATFECHTSIPDCH
jgi:hypothetical protein